MSIPIGGKLDPKTGAEMRRRIEDMLNGVWKAGSWNIQLPDPMDIRKEIVDGEHVRLTWSENPEIDIPLIPDPDLIVARLYPHQTQVQLRLGNIVIDH